MRIEPVQALDVTTEPQATRWLRLPVGIALIIHGLIHLMGVALLLELAEPGDLTYAMARPEPGTMLGIGFAVLWALATVLFVISGYQVMRGGRWTALVIAASIFSLIAVGAMATAAPIGLVISTLTLLVATWFSLQHRN